MTLLAIALAAHAGGFAPAEVEGADERQTGGTRVSGLAGTWELELVIASLTHVPVLGELRTRSRSVLRVEVTDTPTGPVARQQVCTSEVLDRAGLARTILPPAFVRSIPDRTYALVLGADGGVRADLGVEATGWTGEGALPTDAADPRVRDVDGDGRPGATVLVEVAPFGTGHVQFVHRGHSLLEGHRSGPDTVEGGVVVTLLEQQTIGATPRILGGTLRSVPDPAHSSFVMRRTTPATACAPAAAGR
jgi:hypothetical protein